MLILLTTITFSQFKKVYKSLQFEILKRCIFKTNRISVSYRQKYFPATEAIGQNELIKDAKAAIDAVFSELPQLPTAKDTTDSVEPTTPTNPTSDTSDTSDITIEVEAIDTTTNTKEKATEPTTQPTTDTNPAFLTNFAIAVSGSLVQ